MTCPDCDNSVVIDKDFYRYLIDESPLVKQGKPSFKPNPNLGEGKASDDELKYRKELQDELKSLYNKITKTKEKDIPKVIDEYILNSQEIVEKNIDYIYDKSIETGLENLRQVGIDKKKPKEDPESKKALLEWQRYSIYKVGRTIEMDIINSRKGNNYFKTAYGSK